MSRVRYAPSVTPEVRMAIEPHLSTWAHLIPAWCHEVRVLWNDKDTETGALTVKVFYEYRNADVEVLANFLTNPDARAEHVVHELMHLSLAPLTMVAEALRDALVKQVPDVEEWADEQLRQGEEATVCDLANLIGRPAA